jgi:hypothetical protein
VIVMVAALTPYRMARASLLVASSNDKSRALVEPTHLWGVGTKWGGWGSRFSPLHRHCSYHYRHSFNSKTKGLFTSKERAISVKS